MEPRVLDDGPGGGRDRVQRTPAGWGQSLQHKGLEWGARGRRPPGRDTEERRWATPSLSGEGGSLKLATSGPGGCWRDAQDALSAGVAASRHLLADPTQAPSPSVSDLEFSRRLRSLNIQCETFHFLNGIN